MRTLYPPNDPVYLSELLVLLPFLRTHQLHKPTNNPIKIDLVNKYNYE